MKWYLNGSLVSTDSMSYTWNVDKGMNSIKFKGSNGNEYVDKTWLIVIYQDMQVI